MIHDGLWDAFTDVHMGGTAEAVAERFKVSRADMDAYAAESHRRARGADFNAEVLPVEKVPLDEGPRADSTVEKLGTLKPAFKKDGLVTAGNASQLSDGAAALVLMSERALKERKATPLARISGYAVAGVEPQWVLVSTIDAVRKFDARNPWPAKQADLVEINEAFAVSTIAAVRELGLETSQVNADGGAIALGHPIGASGARIVVTLLNSLAKRGLKRGLATLCMGGGNGLALGVERP
jgi:acetyl-CoA C-acetyltransferase